MRYGFENNNQSMEKSSEVNENTITSEQLSESEEISENFDDCSIDKFQDSRGNEVNTESLEEAKEDYDDCENKIEEMEEKNPELADEYNDFNDCGKETDGQYVAEVTYITDGEIDQEEVTAELQNAYNECDDPEDMHQLKETANENEHIEVNNAEVIERPENGDVAEKFTEEEYEQAQEELEEAEETLEVQQEAAQEYSDDLENSINKHENEVLEETENINNDVSEDTYENQEDVSEVEDSNDSEVEESTEDVDFDGEQVEEQAENIDETTENQAENNEKVNEAVSSETEKNAEDVDFDGEQVEEQAESTDETTETSNENNDDANENISSEAEDNVEDIETEDLEEMDDDINGENAEVDDESASEDVSKKVEEQTETELSDEPKTEIQEEVTESLNDEEENRKVFAEKSEEIVNENVEEKKEEKESVKAIEETVEELGNNKIEENYEIESKSLQERIEGTFEKDDISFSEINDLREENATELKCKIEEKVAIEAEIKSKFDEVLSKEKGSEEYKQSLRKYNDLQDQKANLSEQISAMEKQQELLDKKSLELREVQIQKGAEAVATSETTLASVSAIQERYDQTYYDVNPDTGELASIREESCFLIHELSTKKDALSSAMDAKMDEIREYINSQNMDIYEAQKDSYYQKLSAEHTALKDCYEKVSYSIVKLNENNKDITELLGDNFHSMREAGCATFGLYKVDKFGFVMGDNGEEYSKAWEHYDKMPSKVIYYDEPIIETISPSKIEGIHIGDADIDNPSLFWSQHMSNGSEKSFNSIAEKIPDVRMRLTSGETLDSIIQDLEIGDTAAIYFSGRQIPEVIKCGDYYEFQENGRHRILAARNVNCDIPVRVIGERKFLETNTKEIAKSSISEMNDSKEYSEYMNSKYNIAVDQTVEGLALQTVKRASVGFESIIKKYPEVGELVNETTTSDLGVMSCTGDTLLFNPEYFSDNDKLINVCKEMSDSGYWVSNSSPESIGVHEAAHGIEWALIQKNPAYRTEAQRIKAWNNCTEASNIISEACNNIKKSVDGRNKSSTQLVREISIYALDSDSETMAEAFADVYANGDNAKPLSKEIVSITQSKMNEYRKEIVYANKKSSPLGRIFRNR